MTDAAMRAPGARAPWHFWVVVVLAVLWNGFSAYDYVMTMTENQAYFDAMGLSAEQVAYFTNMPLWLDCAWALAVWGAVAGTLFLIVRKAWAVPAFVVSFVFMLCSSAVYLMSETVRAFMGTAGMITIVVIVIVALFEIFYSRAMVRRGVLH